MNPSFIFLQLLIPLIFFISRKVLREKKSFYILFFFCLILTVIGFAKLNQTIRNKPNFNLFLFSPLYSLLLYRLLLIPFWKRKKRDPKIPQRELFYTGDLSLLADKIFIFTFLMLSLLLPFYLITKDFW